MQNETLSTYQKIAGIYAGPEVGEDDPAWREACRSRFVSSLKGKKILEIGCGPAVDGFMLSQLGYDVTVSDASPEFLKIVAARFPNLKSQVLDYTNVNFSRNIYDGILGMATFVHIPHAEVVKTLENLNVALQPGGIVFLTLLQSDLVSEYCVEDFGGPHGGKVSFYCHSPSEFTQWGQAAGFKAIEILNIPSVFYSELPRLKEKQVKQYQVILTN